MTVYQKTAKHKPLLRKTQFYFKFGLNTKNTTTHKKNKKIVGQYH